MIRWVAIVAIVAIQVHGHGVDAAATVDCVTRISLGTGSVDIEHRLTLSRPAAYVEAQAIAASTPEAYFAKVAAEVVAGFDLSFNGEPATLTPVGSVQLEMPFTKVYRFTTPAPAGGAEMAFHNEAFLEIPGQATIEVDTGQWEITDHSQGQPEPWARDILIRYGEPTPSENSTAVFQRVSGAPLAPATVLALAIGLTALRRTRKLGLLALLGAAAFAVSAIRGREVLNPEAGLMLFQNLHAGIYSAFTADSESQVYDSLAESLSGNLLESVYLEVNESLVAHDEGNVRVEVRRVKPLASELLPIPDQRAFRVRHHWRVIGTISHHSHRHARINEYRALYTVSEEPAGWRISAVEIEDQRRK